MMRCAAAAAPLNIKAVATTLEPICSTDPIPYNGLHHHTSFKTSSPNQPSIEEEDVSTEFDLDDKEKLRRMRISKANKGNTPWNKGRKHTPGTYLHSILFFLVAKPFSSFLLLFKYYFPLSKLCAETVQRIKERTRLAMQDPKVMSCKNYFM